MSQPPDGIGDLATGAIQEDGSFVVLGVVRATSGASKTGRVDAISGATGARIWSAVGTSAFPGAAEDKFFGTAVASLGDLTGDGRAEVVVGAPNRPNVNLAGFAVVLSGTGLVLRVVAGLQPDDHFGAAVAGIDDRDGDGLGDIAVGSNPEFKLDRKGYVRLLASSTNVGDVDQDGYADLLVGATENPQFLQSPGYFQLRSGRNGKKVGIVHGNPINDPNNRGDAFGMAAGRATDAWRCLVA